MLTIAAAKANFFRPEAVTDPVERARQGVLSRQGAFVRRRARSLLRYSKNPAAPGKPPHVHRSMTRKKTNKKTGATKTQRVSPLREFVLFAYDATTKTCVAGAAKLNDGSDAPEILEKGGTVGRYKNPRRRERALGEGGEVRIEGGKVVYAKLRTSAQVVRANELNARLYGPLYLGGNRGPHAFMQPALDAEAPNMAEAWRDQVK